MNPLMDRGFCYQNSVTLHPSAADILEAANIILVTERPLSMCVLVISGRHKIPT